MYGKVVRLMLTHLQIKNFTIIDDLAIDLSPGMTVLTGETGAGKSIAIDALGLCLGSRALANTVRPGSTKAELTATFDITDKLEHAAGEAFDALIVICPDE